MNAKLPNPTVCRRMVLTGIAAASLAVTDWSVPRNAYRKRLHLRRSYP
jgi:hypothetical protein